MFGFNSCVYFDKIGRFLASQPTTCRCDKKLAKYEHKMSFDPQNYLLLNSDDRKLTISSC